MIDLHIHTTASDGTVSPTGVVRMAKKAGLAAIGVTDHDTVDAIPEFLRECTAAGIEGVPGIEVGVEHEPGIMHLLGYFIDPDSRQLLDLLEIIGRDRVRRMEGIVERLVGLGVKILPEEISVEAGTAPPGRPHVAILLRNRGVVGSIEEAFVRYLREGSPAYQARVKPTVAEAIEVIDGAGGIAVLAHPISLGLEGGELYGVLRDLAEQGLTGVEVYYPTQEQACREELLRIARSLSLAVAGGSDFHGDVKPDFTIGVGRGDLEIPDSVLHELKRRCRSKKEQGR